MRYINSPRGVVADEAALVVAALWRADEPQQGAGAIARQHLA